MKPLKHSLNEDLCDPKLRQALRINVTEVSGDTETVQEGMAYAVRGTYESEDPSIVRLCLSGHGQFTGRPAAISLGAGDFEVTAEPVEVEAGKHAILDLLMFNEAGEQIGTRLRIQLEEATT
jgi:hypothetical protein